MKQSVFLYGPKPDGPKILSKDRAFRQWELEGRRASLVQKVPIIVEVTDPHDDKALLTQLRAHLEPVINNALEWKLYRAPFAANQFYPRIFRPVYYGATELHVRKEVGHSLTPFNSKIATDTSFQLSVMVKALQRICEVVSPTTDNLNTYGHEIRNLLIIACTEFEAQCKGTLLANGYNKSIMSTKDYIKLLPAMKLEGYSARVSPYADMKDRRPFAAWNSEKPTQTLPWYNAYNLTKHNRETEFVSATLEHALDAIAACAIISFAQYGKLPRGEASTSEFLEVRAKPNWLPFKCYTKIGYSSDDWEKISYPFNG